MNKPAAHSKKLIKLETALLFALIALVVGFLGGVVYSAFNPPPASTRVASNTDHFEHAVSPEHARQIIEMEEKVAESPEDANAWIALGNAYFDHKQPEKAIRAYENALKHQPDNADVWTDLGIMYRQIEKPEKAIAAFDKAREVDPFHEPSLYNKGIVQMHDLNDLKGAYETWSKLLELNPSAATQSGMPVKELVGKLKSPL